MENKEIYMRLVIGIKSGDKFVFREKLDIECTCNLKDIQKEQMQIICESIKEDNWFIITDPENELHAVSILTNEISYFKVEIEVEDINNDHLKNLKNYIQNSCKN